MLGTQGAIGLYKGQQSLCLIQGTRRALQGAKRAMLDTGVTRLQGEMRKIQEQQGLALQGATRAELVTRAKRLYKGK